MHGNEETIPQSLTFRIQHLHLKYGKDFSQVVKNLNTENVKWI
jgi:hypothetical protein